MGVCYGSVSRRELCWLLKLKPALTKSCLLKRAECQASICFFLPPPVRCTPELQAGPGSSPTTPRGTEHGQGMVAEQSESATSGWLLFFLCTLSVAVCRGRKLLPMCCGWGATNPPPSFPPSLHQLCLPLASCCTDPGPFPISKKGAVGSPGSVHPPPCMLCKSLSSRTDFALLSSCSFPSVCSQFHRKPIITMPVACMSQSLGNH